MLGQGVGWYSHVCGDALLVLLVKFLKEAIKVREQVHQEVVKLLVPGKSKDKHGGNKEKNTDKNEIYESIFFPYIINTIMFCQ